MSDKRQDDSGTGPVMADLQNAPRSVQDTVLRNSALLGVVFVFNLFAGLITSSLLTRLLGRDVYGIYGNYFRLYSWLATISAFILPPVVVRYVAELLGAGRQGRAWKLLKISLFLQTANLAIVFAGYIIYAKFTNRPLHAEWVILSAILIAAIGQCFGQLWESFLRGFQNFAAPAAANFAGALARLVGYAALYFAAIGTVAATLFVFAGSNLIYLIVVAIAVTRLRAARPTTPDTPGVEKGLRRRIVDYASTMGIGGLLSMVIWYNIETFMIERWWQGRTGREAELAYYTLAITLSSLPPRVGKMMSQALLPAFSELYGSGEFERLRRGFHQATVLSTMVGAYLCCIGVPCATPFIRLIFPADMMGAILPFQLLLIPVLFMSINHAGSAALPALEGHRYYLLTTVILVPINLALDWWLVPLHGATGASIVNAIMQSVAILTGLYYICVMRKVGFPFRKTAGTVAAAVVCGFITYAVVIAGEKFGWHDFLTLGICGIVSIIAYLLLLRIFGLFESTERNALLRCERLLPNVLKPLYRKFIMITTGQ